MVPRRSLPAMTIARSTPVIGASTSWVTEASQRPATSETSRRPAAISRSMTGLWPIVPISTAVRDRPAVLVLSVGRTPLTRSMSACKSPATRRTATSSAASTNTSTATPPATSEKTSAAEACSAASKVTAVGISGSAPTAASPWRNDRRDGENASAGGPDGFAITGVDPFGRAARRRYRSETIEAQIRTVNTFLSGRAVVCLVFEKSRRELDNRGADKESSVPDQNLRTARHSRTAGARLVSIPSHIDTLADIDRIPAARPRPTFLRPHRTLASAPCHCGR